LKNKTLPNFLSSLIRRTQRQRLMILLVCTLLAAGGSYFFLRDDSGVVVETHTAPAALTVTATKMVETPWALGVNASGVIQPWQEAIISAQLAGSQLIDIRADVGDSVTRGQVLARFDADMLLAERKLLLASVAQAQALANQAHVDHERAKQLKTGGGISAQSLLAAQTQRETTAAQLAMAQAQLATNSLQLHYIEVRAPDDGIISTRNATLGTVGAVGQELFRLIRAGRLEWRGELTAAQITQVTLGQHVKLALPDGSEASAQIRQIAPTLDSHNRLLTIYATLAPGSHARAGMFVNGTIILEQKIARVVPAASVVIRDGRSYVFHLKDNNSVEQMPVQVARRQGDGVDIISDLVPGDAVILQGAGFLNDGDNVRLAPENDSAAAPSVSARGRAHE
jgi:RND family efflux transporter MFP subunit